MHEWALAEAVCTTALTVAKKEQLATITKITIKIGELQQINHEVFKEIMNTIIPEQFPLLKKTKLLLEKEPTTLQCKRCNHTWTFSQMKNKISEEEAESIHFIPEVAFVHTRCPHCSQPDFDIIKGRGVCIQTIQGEKL